jgi:hypothetical protein
MIGVMRRRIGLLECALVAGAIVTVAGGIIVTSGGGAPALSQADWAAWRTTENDLQKRCTIAQPQSVAAGQVDYRDVAKLIRIAKRNPNAWVPDGITNTHVTMNLLLGGIATDIACLRPRLVQRAWTAANALPGGYPTLLSPRAQIRITRLAQDFRLNCHTRATSSAKRLEIDAEELIHYNREAPRAGVLRQLGLVKQNSTPAPWVDLKACAPPNVVAELARAAGTNSRAIGG